LILPKRYSGTNLSGLCLSPRWGKRPKALVCVHYFYKKRKMSPEQELQMGKTWWDCRERSNQLPAGEYTGPENNTLFLWL